MPVSYSSVMAKDTHEGDGVIPEQRSSSLHQYLAAFSCSILAFSCGQIVGWTSSAIPQFEEGILPGGPVSQENIGWIGGALCLGALISSPFHGLLADAKGRKFAAYNVGLTFVIGWSIMIVAESLWCVLVARFFAGLGSSGTFTIVAIYNSEIGEPRLRASLGGFMAVGYTTGILCAYMLGAWVSYNNVIVIYLCIVVAFFPVWWCMPESPAYLLLKGQDKEALRVLRWLQGSQGPHAQESLNRLKKEQAGAVKPASLAQFFKDPIARKGLLLALILSFIQIFCGVFAVLNYATSIISSSGGLLSPIAGSLLFGSLMVAGSLLPPIVADSLPRKVILGISCSVLSVGMAVLGTMQYLQANGLDISISWLGYVPIVVLSVAVFFYFIGLGSVLYITIVEMFSDETRGVAGAFVALAMWGTSFFLLRFFGVAVEAFGDYSVFYFFSGICAFGLLFIIVFIPETRGKTPEEVAAILIKR